MHLFSSKLARMLSGFAVSIIAIGFFLPWFKFTAQDLCTIAHRFFEAGLLLCALTIIVGHTAQFRERATTGRQPLSLPLVGSYLFGLFALSLVIPTFDGGCGSRAWWNERTVPGAIRSVIGAQSKYRDYYPSVGYACSIRFLGPPAGAEPPSPSAADLVDDVLAEGMKSGYEYRLSCATDRRSYSMVAIPVLPRESGNNAYCTDESGVIRQIDERMWQSCLNLGKTIP